MKAIITILIQFSVFFMQPLLAQSTCNIGDGLNINCDDPKLDQSGAQLVEEIKNLALKNKTAADSIVYSTTDKLKTCGEDSECLERVLSRANSEVRQELASLEPNADNQVSTIKEKSVEEKIPPVDKSNVEQRIVDTDEVTSLSEDNRVWIYLAIYLIVFVFLRYAKNNPDVSMRIVSLIYLIIGFPIIVTFKIIKSATKSRGNEGQHQVDRREDASSNRRNDHPERETIDIQYQRSSGSWNTLNSFDYLGNEQQIFHAMKNASNSTALKGSGATGKIRAKGRRTGTIYDQS